VLSIFLFTGMALEAQDIVDLEKNNWYSSEELQEDYTVFRKALESTYPSLYRFADSISITNYLNNKINALGKSMTEVEFYKQIALTCARINDEHLIPTPSKLYYQHLEKSNHFFPFSIKIIDRRIYVLKSYLIGEGMPLGSEILSINGHTAEEILNTLLPTIPSDGYIQTFKIRHLEDYCMTQNENLFDLNYPIFIEDVDSFRMEFVHPQLKSKKLVLTFAGLDFNQYKKFYKSRRQYNAPLEFKYLTDDIAYLRIHSFHKMHRDDFEQDFYSLYDDIFNELRQKRTNNLILDLRNNEGGDGTGEALISYLITKPYKLLSYIEEKFTGYPPVVEYLENGSDLQFIDSIMYKTNTGMYRLKKEFYHYVPRLVEQEPTSNHYKGKLYVLINGASGSMAAVVASFIKAYSTAIFIGEESGGTMEGNTSEAYALLVLPNSKIRVMIPLTKKVYNLNPIKGRGVLADHHIVPKIEDLLNGVDTELNFALDLITKKSK